MNLEDERAAQVWWGLGQRSRQKHRSVLLPWCTSCTCTSGPVCDTGLSGTGVRWGCRFIIWCRYGGFMVVHWWQCRPVTQFPSGTPTTWDNAAVAEAVSVPVLPPSQQRRNQWDLVEGPLALYELRQIGGMVCPLHQKRNKACLAALGPIVVLSWTGS